MDAARVHAVSRVALACIWVYQGLVPKILFPETGDRALTVLSGVSPSLAPQITIGVGLIEVALGFSLLILWRARWLFVVQGVALLLLPLGLALRSPISLATPLGPIPVTMGMVALGWIGWTCGASAGKS
jgi:hypothetical protein